MVKAVTHRASAVRCACQRGWRGWMLAQRAAKDKPAGSGADDAGSGHRTDPALNRAVPQAAPESQRGRCPLGVASAVGAMPRQGLRRPLPARATHRHLKLRKPAVAAEMYTRLLQNASVPQREREVALRKLAVCETMMSDGIL